VGSDKSKNFTTKSLYRFLTHRGVVIANSKSIRKTKLPLKIKVFVWQLSNNKLQAAVSLKKRCCFQTGLERGHSFVAFVGWVGGGG
jgi:hypothetical protein